MLGYAHINLISMLKRFEPEEVVRVATDSLYIQKSALHKLEGVKAYSPPKSKEKYLLKLLNYLLHGLLRTTNQ